MSVYGFPNYFTHIFGNLHFLWIFCSLFTFSDLCIFSISLGNLLYCLEFLYLSKIWAPFEIINEFLLFLFFNFEKQLSIRSDCLKTCISLQKYWNWAPRCSKYPQNCTFFFIYLSNFFRIFFWHFPIFLPTSLSKKQKQKFSFFVFTNYKSAP